MDDPDARALVEAALRHDDEAARELVRRLYPLVAKMVRAHRPRRTSEEDLCQMIFIKVFHKLSQFSGKVPLEHWVSRIAVNTCLNQIAAEKVRPELRHADLSEEEQAVVENLAVSSHELAPDERFASRQLVEHLLDLLKPVERLVIDLLYLQGRSVEEIRKITGWSTSLIKVRAFRARQKMRNQLIKISARENL
ncbi:MAG TPA: RNA polymerase subunit sigma-24 [Spartobacteria bacterium]|jgi:RNA polymerase sigma factor (sigma-70 family)|nr:RNA polymerase subunit sigma-24 [Spartobacteria bacterium]HAK07563.1 RNA polymerase subunit sigma-24 [Spartobacteria bacterium]HCP91408.1 RNA polymerase subunit sigma-24 [Spartobacteria bacterium]